MIKLIWRNLWRNGRRTSITVASIVFAVLFSILMQSYKIGVFNNLIKNVVGYYSGYIQIHKKGYWEEQVVDNCFELKEVVVKKIKKIPDVEEVIPRIESFILISKGSTTKGCMLIGIDLLKENKLTKLQNKLCEGIYSEENKKGALISEGLAKRLNLIVNDTIVLFGQGFHGAMAAGKFKIAGIVKFSAPTLNNSLVYLPLSATQELLSAENKVTQLALKISNSKNVSATKNKILKILSNEYEVMDWEEMMPEISNHIKADGISFSVFIGILYLIIGFGLFGTILMMITERKYEFGMLIAIGMKKNTLRLILIGETLVIAFLGVFIGSLLSFPLVIFLEKHPIKLGGEMATAYEKFGFEAIFPTEFDPKVFMIQSLIVLCMSFVIGLYPLLHVGRIDPLKSMKK